MMLWKQYDSFSQENQQHVQEQVVVQQGPQLGAEPQVAEVAVAKELEAEIIFYSFTQMIVLDCKSVQRLFSLLPYHLLV